MARRIASLISSELLGLSALVGFYVDAKENVADLLRTRVGPRRDDANHRVVKEADLSGS